MVSATERGGSNSTLRRKYAMAALAETGLDPNPFRQFARWFQEAVRAGLTEPTAMTLATATKSGKPSARVVLLKSFDENGFVFYTNYLSHKGRQLAGNPNAALVFHWVELDRQVRITGSVTKVSRQQSENYFRTRPLGSRLGAWASKQGEVIAGRRILESRLKALAAKYRDREIPVPPYWGGFRVKPSGFEFWQGRPNRLHDRLRYTSKRTGKWKIERLSP